MKIKLFSALSCVPLIVRKPFVHSNAYAYAYDSHFTTKEPRMEQMIMANYKYRKLLLAVLLVIGTSNAKASFGQLNENGYSISNCLT